MIARVTLDLALGRDFDYRVPPELAARAVVGARVKVPFGPRQVLGTITGLLDSAEAERPLKPVLKVLGTQSLLTPRLLALARWLAGYYVCPLERVVKTVLPEAVRREEAGWRERLFVLPLPIAGEPPRLTRRQQEIWHLVEERRGLPLQELLRLTGTTTDTVRRLEDKGLVQIAPQVAERDPCAGEYFVPTRPLALNAGQSRALAAIVAALDRAPAAASDAGERSAVAGPASAEAGRTFLLHGVTGSGKTEVYLQALAACLERGRGGIVLVPEIALTPQTIERFKARFSHGPHRTLVAVLHSHLSAGERHDEWHKIREGRARIVVGARSAVFAPVEPLGLIIVDEEHEHSYKQEEAPRYHARDVAVWRGRQEGAVVVLGSATPSLESYYNARRGKYTLLELPERVDDRKLPLVRVVDMRQEARRERGIPIFSPLLREALMKRLERGEQAMLFLNRRGYASALQCPLCGYVAGCPHCSVALTYHRTDQRLRCHLCGHAEPAPAVCPAPGCGNPALRYAGLGTQRVEVTLRRLFPRARIERMDSDRLERKEDYRRILGDFRTGKIDVLVGTQMIAKGLHFPNVTLVGIIYADLSLHLPDFRAAERTFQLLTQVSGRAGRGDVEGEVIVQSFTPFHPAIQYARRHDFVSFYEQEIEFRQQLQYPPLTRIALLTLRGRNEDKVKFIAEHLRRQVIEATRGLPDLQIAGPAAAPLLKAQTFYRYQLMLRTRHMSRLSLRLGELQSGLSLPDGVTLTVDVDPVALL